MAHLIRRFVVITAKGGRGLRAELWGPDLDVIEDACEEVAEDYFEGDLSDCRRFLLAAAERIEQQVGAFPFKVYRGLSLPAGARPRLEQSGQQGHFQERVRGYWTPDREVAEDFAMTGGVCDEVYSPGHTPWLLTGAVTTPAAILWYETLVQRVKFGDEEEIVFSEYAGVENIRAGRLDI